MDFLNYTICLIFIALSTAGSVIFNVQGNTIEYQGCFFINSILCCSIKKRHSTIHAINRLYEERNLDMKLIEIGIIHSLYKEAKDAPRQGRLSDKVSEIQIHKEYTSAMAGVEDLSHIIVLYWADRADRSMKETSRRRPTVTGIFATRSPARPNPIAFCVCKILEVNENMIRVTGLDALDGSPLLDIKVYSAGIDCYPEAGKK